MTIPIMWLPHRRLQNLLVLVPALLLLHTSDGTPQLCPQQNRTLFLNSLSEQCRGALSRLEYRVAPLPLSPVTFNLTNATTADLDTACQPSCAGAYASFLRDNCSDIYTARSVAAMCEPSTGQMGPRCRKVFPDAIRVDVDAIRGCNFTHIEQSDMSACPTKPNLCAFMSTAIDILGCCYNSVINNTDFNHYLLGRGQISEYVVGRHAEVGMSPMWHYCQITVPPKCEGGIP